MVEYICTVCRFCCRCIGRSRRRGASPSTGKLEMKRFPISFRLFNFSSYFNFFIFYSDHCDQVSRDYRASESYLDQEAVVFHGPSLSPGNHKDEFLCHLKFFAIRTYGHTDLRIYFDIIIQCRIS